MIVAVVFGTARMPAFDHVPAYVFLLTAYAYCLDVFWFSCIGFGMLYLRLWPGSNWKKKSPIPHYAGVAAAVIFTAANVFPLVVIWAPDPAEAFLAHTKGLVPWFASQTTAIAVIAASAIYWLGFRFYLYQKKARQGLKLDVIRSPIFWRDARTKEIVQIYEIVRLRWTLWKQEPKDRRSHNGTELSVLSTQESRPQDWRSSSLRYSGAN